jgi:hypothetical protein
MVMVMVMTESQQDEGVERLVKELSRNQISRIWGGNLVRSVCVIHSLIYRTSAPLRF